MRTITRRGARDEGDRASLFDEWRIGRVDADARSIGRRARTRPGLVDRARVGGSDLRQWVRPTGQI